MSNLGVDSGGTFTDLVLAEEGKLRIHKIPSTPRNPAEAFLKGLVELCRTASPEYVTHGSTVATNALLERKGARVALVTTAGFEDVLEIGRQNRPSLYDLEVDKPLPLVARQDIFGVHERTLYDGTTDAKTDVQEVERIAETIHSCGYDSIALCFLHSYANPQNERLALEILAKAGVPILASHQVLPEYREYERFSTTSLNAYVSPKMSTYLSLLERGIPKSSRFRIMQSNGGAISASRARAEAVQTILSGPAAGVVGAFEVARQAGFDRVITFDMGGTSTDVSLCNGAISMRARSTIADLPIGIPVVDIHTVGAGGGSIAWLDSAGSLHVGPQSAGADPGPVCYGSGTQLTVTDANLCLGRMLAAHFLGGAMKLDVDRSRERMLKFANHLGMSLEKVAEGIVEVANATMERAIRVISVERGHDPRGFSLVAFGGAGPMHACDIARTLAIPKTIVPYNAGVLSAYGLLMADVTKDFSQTVLLKARDITEQRLRSLFVPLESQAREVMKSEGFEPDRFELRRFLDVRYFGQSYEVTIPASPDFEKVFHTEHYRLYGHSNVSRPVELVNVRLRAIGRVEQPKLPTVEESEHISDRAKIGKIPTLFGGRKFETPVYERLRLLSGNRFCGPAIVVEMSATTVVAPDFEASVDCYGNIIMSAYGT